MNKIIQFPGSGLVITVHGDRRSVTVEGTGVKGKQVISRQSAAKLLWRVKEAIHAAHRKHEEEVFGKFKRESDWLKRPCNCV